MEILMTPVRDIPFTHYTFDVALSPPRFPAHWLPSTSFLIRLLSCFDLYSVAAVWENFFLSHLQTSAALRHCSSTCTNPPNLSTGTFFPTNAHALILINFPIQQLQVRRPLARTSRFLVLHIETQDGPTLPLHLRLVSLGWSFAMPVMLAMLVLTYVAFNTS